MGEHSRGSTEQTVGRHPFIGPSALVATLNRPRTGKDGRSWQYHPRSDYHSKVPCLLMAVDLLLESERLRDAVASGRVACGINHVMTDHRSKRKKAFDLVFHRPSSQSTGIAGSSFRGLLERYAVVLTAPQRALVESVPDIPVHDVAANAVYIAFEAKACMTQYGKARPRLFDELNSSHSTIHGDTEKAIAAGFVLVNAASRFISPLRNPPGLSSPIITVHKQPEDFRSVIQKVRELPLRSYSDEVGFDAIGIVAIECQNDGSAIRLINDIGDLKDYEYESMITRVAHLFESRFHRA